MEEGKGEGKEKEQEVTQHPGHGVMINTSMLGNSSTERRSRLQELPKY